jgi:hypothetical protein
MTHHDVSRSCCIRAPKAKNKFWNTPNRGCARQQKICTLRADFFCFSVSVPTEANNNYLVTSPGIEPGLQG